MIVSVSIIFFILEAPVLIFICLMQGKFISESWPHVPFVWTFVNLMMYTNHVINFFSYCMTGTKFRRELLRLFHMHKALRFMSVYKNVNLLTSAGGGGGGGGNAGAAAAGHHRNANHHHHAHQNQVHYQCNHSHHHRPLGSQAAAAAAAAAAADAAAVDNVRETNFIVVGKPEIDLIGRNANAATNSIRNAATHNKVISHPIQ